MSRVNLDDKQSELDVEDKCLLKRLNGAIEKNVRLKEWIIQAFPIMMRAFSVVIQENRINEIEGCQEILESCPMEIPYEMGVSNRGWIHVNERLPEWEAPVLGLVAISPDPVIRIAALSRVDKRGRMWYLGGYGPSYSITHWRPLPMPPTQHHTAS